MITIVNLKFSKIVFSNKKRKFSTTIIYYSDSNNINDPNEEKRELSEVRRELEEITDELVDIEDEAFGMLTSKSYTESVRNTAELNAEQSAATREQTYNKYYEEYLSYKDATSRLPNATEPSWDDFNDNTTEDPKIDSIGASLQEEQNNNSIQTIRRLTSIIIPNTQTPELISNSEEATGFREELDELKVRSYSLACEHAMLVGNPEPPSDPGDPGDPAAEGDSSSGSTSRGSLLDDYADTSTEPADYMGGDD